jgi:hypothetical protein
MGSLICRIAAIAAALLFSVQLSAQNPNNPIEVGLLRWYQANETAQIATCSFPGGLAFDGAHMWVACESLKELQEFNTSDGTLVRTVTGLVEEPAHLLYDGANVWVSGGGTSIIKVKASTGAVLGTFTVPGQGGGMAFDGQYVWVANNTNYNGVSKLLATTGAVTTYTLSGCNTANDLAFDGTNIWVSCLNTSNVLELSSTGSVLNTFTLGGIGVHPEGITFDGTNIWVAVGSGAAGSLDRINVTTLAETSFSVGSYPFNLTFDSVYIWVTDSGVSTVSKFLASTGALVGTYAVSSPGSIAFDGGNIWVATGSATGTLSKF